MKKLYIFALVAMLFAACATDAIDEQSVKVEEPTPDTLVGTFEGDDSRIQLQNGKTVWTKGDLVSVFYRSNANQKWQYQGETGERTGTIKRVADAEATQELSDIVVVYPYNENYYINPRTYNVQAFLPAEQTYLANSYGLDGNIMISASEYKSFSLKNVCGWLKIQLTGSSSQKVTSITLKGNNGEQVAGEIYINSADASCELASKSGVLGDDLEVGGTIFEEGTVLTSVTLNCGEGVALSSSAKSFYIALSPQTFEKGLTIEVACSDGSTMTKSTENAIAIERNCIQPMAVINVISWKDLSTNGTANCYIVSEKGHYSFDATIIGNGQNGIIADAGFHTSSASISPKRVSLLWDENSIVSDLHLKDGKVYFTASSNRGNALIAVKDSSDNIIWSWHIWATEKPKEHTYYSGDIVLDRNLGAITSYYQEGVEVEGLYYQWGRKDPYTKNTTNLTQLTSDTGTITYSISNPTVFIGGRYVSNWLYDANIHLWGYPSFVKTIYDPCPTGYMVPNTNTWYGLERYNEDEFGWWFVVNNDVVAYYPYGFLHEDLGARDEIRGDYTTSEPWRWSSNWVDDMVFGPQLSFDKSNGQYNSLGLSVRCIKE